MKITELEKYCKLADDARDFLNLFKTAKVLNPHFDKATGKLEMKEISVFERWKPQFVKSCSDDINSKSNGLGVAVVSEIENHLSACKSIDEQQAYMDAVRRILKAHMVRVDMNIMEEIYPDWERVEHIHLQHVAFLMNYLADKIEDSIKRLGFYVGDGEQDKKEDGGNTKRAFMENLKEWQRKCFQNAIGAKMMNDTSNGFKWLYGDDKGKARLAFFLQRVFNPDGCGITPYKELEKLFGVRNLSQSVTQLKDSSRTRKWREEIISITKHP